MLYLKLLCLFSHPQLSKPTRHKKQQSAELQGLFSRQAELKQDILQEILQENPY